MGGHKVTSLQQADRVKGQKKMGADHFLADLSIVLQQSNFISITMFASEKPANMT